MSNREEREYSEKLFVIKTPVAGDVCVTPHSHRLHVFSSDEQEHVTLSLKQLEELKRRGGFKCLEVFDGAATQRGFE